MRFGSSINLIAKIASLAAIPLAATLSPPGAARLRARLPAACLRLAPEGAAQPAGCRLIFGGGADRGGVCRAAPVSGKVAGRPRPVWYAPLLGAPFLLAQVGSRHRRQHGGDDDPAFAYQRGHRCPHRGGHPRRSDAAPAVEEQLHTPSARRRARQAARKQDRAVHPLQPLLVPSHCRDYIPGTARATRRRGLAGERKVGACATTPSWPPP